MSERVEKLEIVEETKGSFARLIVLKCEDVCEVVGTTDLVSTKLERLVRLLRDILPEIDWKPTHLERLANEIARTLVSEGWQEIDGPGRRLYRRVPITFVENKPRSVPVRIFRLSRTEEGVAA